MSQVEPLPEKSDREQPERAEQTQPVVAQEVKREQDSNNKDASKVIRITVDSNALQPRQHDGCARFLIDLIPLSLVQSLQGRDINDLIIVEQCERNHDQDEEANPDEEPPKTRG